MERERLIQEMQICADLFYQNQEQAAYEALAGLFTSVNAMLQQTVATSAGERLQRMIALMKAFLEAYQYKDNLALADILYYGIPEEIEGH